MATIEERVKNLIKNIIKDCIDFENGVVNISILDKYVTNALTEQDRIARAEERERCFVAIKKWRCRQCRFCPYYDKTTCPQLKDIRKAL